MFCVRRAESAPPSRRRITVGDPIKKVEGSMFPGMKGGYVMYRVDTHDPEHGSHTSVRRRFRDFVVSSYLCGAICSTVVYTLTSVCCHVVDALQK